MAEPRSDARRKDLTEQGRDRLWALGAKPTLEDEEQEHEDLRWLRGA